MAAGRKRLAVLGAGGSLGGQVLAEARSGGLDVVGMGFGWNAHRASRALGDWRPALVWYPDDAASSRGPVPPGARLAVGPQGLLDFLDLDAETLVVAVPSLDPLELCLKWLEQGRTLVVASKELLVAGGALLAGRGPGRIRLLDSELSALSRLLELLGGEVVQAVLPASGGPLWGRETEEIVRAGPAAVLRHPVWRMGPKITVDSATFVNKLFEILAAEVLWGLPAGSVGTVVHPECRVHAMARGEQGGWLWYVDEPSMGWAIRWALGLQEPPAGDMGWSGMGFHPVPLPFQRALALAESARLGAVAACLVGADEVLVSEFLTGGLSLGAIWAGLEAVAEVARSEWSTPPGSPEDVAEAAAWGRDHVRAWLKTRKKS